VGAVTDVAIAADGSVYLAAGCALRRIGVGMWPAAFAAVRAARRDRVFSGFTAGIRGLASDPRAAPGGADRSRSPAISL
jgi:hypothetical protein